MARSHRWLVPLVLGGIGLPFAIAGGCILFWVPRALDRTIEQVSELRLSTVQSLKEVGVEVMVEGVISDRTPTAYETLVAYRISERVWEDGEYTWKSRGSETPPLWLTLPDGTVTLQAGYTLGNTTQGFEVSRDRHYAGIQVGDPVLVLGTLAAKATADAPPQIDAREVTVDTVDSYLESLATDKRVFQWMGAGFATVGGGLLLGSAIGTGYSLRRGC